MAVMSRVFIVKKCVLNMECCVTVLSGNVFLVIFKPKHGQLSCSRFLPFALLLLSHTWESVNTAPFPGGGVFSSCLSVFVSGLRQTQLC